MINAVCCLWLQPRPANIRRSFLPKISELPNADNIRNWRYRLDVTRWVCVLFSILTCNVTQRTDVWERTWKRVKSLPLWVCWWLEKGWVPVHVFELNDPKVFKLGTGNDLGISYNWHDFGVERSKVKVTGSKSLKTYWRQSSGRREFCTELSAQPRVSSLWLW